LSASAANGVLTLARSTAKRGFPQPNEFLNPTKLTIGYRLFGAFLETPSAKVCSIRDFGR